MIKIRTKVENVLNTDLLIIGGGAAGVRACHEAVLNGIENITIVTKGRILKTGSSFFPLVHGWGIQAFIPGLNNNDSFEKFYNEIIDRGLGMADEKMAHVLVHHAYKRVFDLQKLGLKLNMENNNLKQIIGCFSEEKRALAALDMENIRVTFKKMLHSPNINIIQDFMVLDLLIKENICFGAIGINDDKEIFIIKTKACIIASGGGSNVYYHSLNSFECTGDTYGIALRAGLELYNMEFIQFIFGLIFPKKLIFSERALFYSPPILNSNKKFFIQNYLPTSIDYQNVLKERILHGPFSSRNISKYFDIAIFKEIRNGNGTTRNGVIVDLSGYWNNSKSILTNSRWSNITDNWINWLKYKHSIDVTDTPLEIDHSAHAFNGGIRANEETVTRINNLFVCGEALAGPHGADRLGGNMMAATQVFGAIAGNNASKWINSIDGKSIGKFDSTKLAKKAITLISEIASKSGEHNYKEIKEEIRRKMWSYAHIVKNGKTLIELKQYLNETHNNILNLTIKNMYDLKKKYELLNLVLTGLSITLASIERKESRGSFYREDYPELDSNFSKPINIILNEDKNVLELKS